jgi:dienelactone hydrolase
MRRLRESGTSGVVTSSFVIPATRAAWQRQRRRIQVTLRNLLGDLPPRPARLHVTTHARERRHGYTLERFSFDNGAGATVPGYLLIPSTASARHRAPAVLYHHWHGDEYDVGKDELFQHAHTPEAPGPALARRGYVVMAIDAYGFGERSGRGPGGPGERGAVEELSASKLNLWLGRSLWGMILRDDRLALDYLASRRDVDASRIGATGISMGATRTWWLMALDARVAAGVSIACLTRYTELVKHRQLAAHGIYYYVPGMLAHFDTEAVVSLIAPRPALFLNGDLDAGSPSDGIRLIAAAARPAWTLYGAGADFQSRIYRGVGHACVPDMWTRMWRWFDRYLGARSPVAL